jgi:hypothetical protein
MAKKRNTVRNSARKSGIPKSSLQDWKRQGAPIDDPEALGVWIAENDKRGHDPKAIQAARLRVFQETARKLKIQNDEKERVIIDRSEVEQALHRIIPKFFDRIETALCYELPPSLAGKPPETIGTICREAITKITNQAKAEMQEIAKA